MNNIIIIILSVFGGFFLGILAFIIYRKLSDKNIYVRYDQAKLGEIQRRSDEILTEIKLRNPDIRDKTDALAEFDRHRNTN